ncbi:uncharacterized protein F5Z01DRAFT_617641 [Emericellopsis atlantica]|uniref:Uncharacterized protein n=1 Tax=Emericellopsis atlantica TaxID=2614577 RepID=A0A9P7ZSK4_9HYPO|nr:uncharacterized protein F5Z01DRAFT_617641 [Emericellopsis atlantica]KAG9256910.1 hypothetical protein F5Z01DRAFT_617641 [Emericellopsis atlantica]
MGRYRPPSSTDPSLGSSSSRPAKRQKPSQPPTIRFEMPYHVWCTTCPQPTLIPQGVRFNATKKAAGKYHTTTIWEFRFKHTECGGEVVMQTDPKNTAYVVLSGGTKREYGEDESGVAPIMTDQEKEALRKNAFAKLERTISDREALIQANDRIEDLLDDSYKFRHDTYSQNQKLRKSFRAGRHDRERMAKDTEALQDRMNFGLDVLPESEEDKRRAALVDFAAKETQSAMAKPMFASAAAVKQLEQPERLLKRDKEANTRKSGFVKELMGNTRAVHDPFLADGKGEKTGARIAGVKRKQDLASREDGVPPVKAQEPTSGLVDYDSD